MLTIYGIKNCNTMKKAFDSLNDQGVAYDFFDYKKSLLSPEDFARFESLFKDRLINRQGTTYRKLSEAHKAILAGNDSAAKYDIVKDNQSILKRPIIIGEHEGQTVALIGFDEQWQQYF